MYFDDVYAVYERTTGEVLTVVMPPSNVFWGGSNVDKWVFYLAISGKLQPIKRI